MSRESTIEAVEERAVGYELRAASLGRGELAVASFRATEEMSRPFSFDITFVTDLDIAALEGTLLGEPATFVMGGSGHPARVAGGVVSRVRSLGVRGHDRRAAGEIRLVPRMWLLTLRRDSRIFQNQSVVDVVSAVLAFARIRARWTLERPHRPRAYCVQYRETDYAFVSRLCAEEGIFFSFESGLSAREDGGAAITPTRSCSATPRACIRRSRPRRTAPARSSTRTPSSACRPRSRIARDRSGAGSARSSSPRWSSGRRATRSTPTRTGASRCSSTGIASDAKIPVCGANHADVSRVALLRFVRAATGAASLAAPDLDDHGFVASTSAPRAARPSA
jgi:type VI secretion system secreted protein VgrG